MCNVELKERVIENYIKSALKRKKKEKIAIIMVGGPGSGKTNARIEVIEKLKMNTEDFVIVDQDIIVTKYFNNDNKCRNEVNKINDHLYQKAYEGGYNLVFDGTGRNFKYYNDEVINKLKQLSYTTHLCIVVLAKLDEALKSIQTRAGEEGRDVSSKFATDAYSELRTSIPQYLNLPCPNVDYIYLFDNTYFLRLQLVIECAGNQRIMYIDYPETRIGGKAKSRSKSKKRSKSRSKSKKRSKSRK
jgi:predicted ABC-type ATPase